MPKKLIGFRLDEAGEAKLNLLVAGARSREEWFRGVMRERAERRVNINEAALIGFREVARAASDDGDTAKKREYLDLISQYESEIAILRRTD